MYSSLRVLKWLPWSETNTTTVFSLRQRLFSASSSRPNVSSMRLICPQEPERFWGAVPGHRTTAEWVKRSDRTLGQVIRLLQGCCTSVTSRRAATYSLMVMQEICNNAEVGFEGGQYARTEEELYEKAIALLEKCKIETRRSGQKIPEPTAETPPITV